MEKYMKKYFAIFMLPTLLAFTIVFLAPFAMGIFLSFCKFTTVTDAKWVGLNNYLRIFANKDFTNALWFSTKYTVVSVITINLLAFALALMLTRGIKGTNAFRTIIFMPNLVGGIVLGYIWQLIINGVLSLVDVTVTVDPQYGFWGMVIMSNWQMVGYMMIIYIAGIQNVPDDVNEAALIDGAGPWQMLRRITLPLVMPSFTICLFLTLTNSFKMFDQNLALTAGAPGKKTAMVALDIFNTFFGRTGWEGVGQAKAVIFFLIIMVLAFIQLRLTRSKEVDG